MLALLYPTSRADLVVDVGARHSHQILLWDPRGEMAGREQPDMTTSQLYSVQDVLINFPRWIPIKYISLIVFVQLLIIMMEQYVDFTFKSILGIFIFYSTLLEVEKQEDSIWF